jgi:hypothetical protein
MGQLACAMLVEDLTSETLPAALSVEVQLKLRSTTARLARPTK